MHEMNPEMNIQKSWAWIEVLGSDAMRPSIFFIAL
jgi:hypothetical protein